MSVVVCLLVSVNNACRSVETFFDTSSMLIIFILLGKYLEALAKLRTSDAIAKLMGLKVSTATLVLPSGEEKVIDANLIQKGDFLKVTVRSCVSVPFYICVCLFVC